MTSYSTCVVTTNAFQFYEIVTVTPSFFLGGEWAQTLRPHTWNLDHDSVKRLQWLQSSVQGDIIHNSNVWRNVSTADCVRVQDLEADHGSSLVVLTSEAISGLNLSSSVLKHKVQDPLRWGIDLYRSRNLERITHSGRPEDILRCMTLNVPPRCRVQIHIWIMFTVTLFTFMVLMCFAGTYMETKGSPLMTTGDAIASCLDSPCMFSNDACLISQNEMARVFTKNNDGVLNSYSRSEQFAGHQTRYFQSVSLLHRAMYLGSYVGFHL